MFFSLTYKSHKRSYSPFGWVGVLLCFFVYKPVHSQCSFERLNTDKTVASYNPDKILELRNKNIIYLNRGIYTQALLNDSDTYNGLMEVTDACGTLLHSWVVSYGAGQDAIYDALETSDGNVLILLYTEASNWRNSYNLALMKINPYTGQVYWKQAYPRSRLSVGYGLSYNQFKNTYVIAAHAEFARKAGEMYALNKGYLLEVDTAGSILHQQFYPPATTDSITDKFDTYFIRAVAIDSLHTMVLGVYFSSYDSDTNYFINIYDSAFKIVEHTFPLRGIYRTQGETGGNRVGSNALENAHQLVLNVEAVKIADFPEPRGNLLAVIDMGGQLVKHVLLEESKSLHLTRDVNFVSVTPDGGFLVPNGYIKLDSNLQLVSTVYPKDYDATSFNYAIQLQDGSYTGIGSVWMQNNKGEYFAAQYTHRTNTKGWYTGLPQQEFTTDEVEIYPNPTSGVITLKTRTPMLGKLTVINALGKQVFSGELTWNNELDLSHLSMGMYWVTIHLSNGQDVTKKLVLAN